MTRLVARDFDPSLLADAIEADARLLIVADDDCDGATACAVGLRGLRMLAAGSQASIDYLVPNRFEYGYGLTPEIVELARGSSPDLIITVDNGISSHDGVAAARQVEPSRYTPRRCRSRQALSGDPGGL